MFLQVYADGTVIESGGTHSVGRQAIKEVIEALEASELYRVKGHCGGPATDFVEQVQMVVYERSMRGIRANAFSFSGNTQGCSHPVQHLQKALDNLQNKVSKNTSSMGEPSSGGNMMATNPLNTDPATRPAPILLNAEPGSSR